MELLEAVLKLGSVIIGMEGIVVIVCGDVVGEPILMSKSVVGVTYIS
jgi:hypothetical protein